MENRELVESKIKEAVERRERINDRQRFIENAVSNRVCPRCASRMHKASGGCYSFFLGSTVFKCGRCGFSHKLISSD